MARSHFRDSYCITQDTDTSMINNKRGMARRAKTQSNKRDRQFLLKDLNKRIVDGLNNDN